MRNFKRSLAFVCTAAFLSMGALASSASGAVGDPTFVYTPKSGENGAPPSGDLNGPCGLAVDVAGNFYVSDYYRHTVDVFTSSHSYKTRLSNEDPLDGPCGLALDSAGALYINNYHRDVVKFSISPYPPAAVTNFGVGTTIDSAHPTGVAVDSATNNAYVDDRTYVSVYGPTGVPVEEGGLPVKLGLGTLGDGYGLAVSEFSGTFGRVYVPDASTDTVKVYDPGGSDKVNPVSVIIGPPGGFSSLRDSAIAIDRVSGNVYVADSVGAALTEHPETTIDVFSSAGAYQGHLKFNVVNGAPVGLAVDNSVGSGQGRVYVTSGNANAASVYAYPPGSAIVGASQPAIFNLGVSTSGNGFGWVTDQAMGINCSAACEAEAFAGEEVLLSAMPEQGSTFEGWSGGGCSGTGSCQVRMEATTAVVARFGALPPPASGAGTEVAGPPSAGVAPEAASRRHRAKRHHNSRRHHPHKKR
jgi:hypothetical protein